MNEGEDPKTPITPDDNPPVDNSDANDAAPQDDGMFSISHGDDSVEASEEAEVSAEAADAEPQDIFASDSSSESAPETPEPIPSPAPLNPTPNQTIDTLNNPTEDPNSPFDSQRVTGGSNYAQRRSGGRRDFSSTGPSTPDFFSNAMAANDASIAHNQVENNRKRKIFVIIAIIAVVLVLLVVGILLIAGMPKSVSSKDTLIKFNSFANYLINGSESTVSLSGGYSDDKDYFALQLYPGNEKIKDEQRKEFAGKAAAFVDVANGAQVSGELKESLKLFANKTYAWSLYASYSIDSQELLKIYEEKGEGKAARFINDKYSKLQKIEGMDGFHNSINDSLKLQLDYIKMIEVDGCKLSNMTDECNEKMHRIDNDSDTLKRINERLEDAESLAKSQLNEAIKMLWDISKQLSQEVN